MGIALRTRHLAILQVMFSLIQQPCTIAIQTRGQRAASRQETVPPTSTQDTRSIPSGHVSNPATDSKQFESDKNALVIAEHNASEFENNWETALEVSQRLQAEKIRAQFQAKEPKDDGKSVQRKPATGKMVPVLPFFGVERNKDKAGGDRSRQRDESCLLLA